MANEETQHLEYFKVENFKCLESLELKDIAQFNLILGDNNVGKSSVLEALLFDENPNKHLRTLYSIYVHRIDLKKYIGDRVNYIESFIGKKDNTNQIEYEYKFHDEETSAFKFGVLDTNGINQDQINNLIENTLITNMQIPKLVASFIHAKGFELYTLDFGLHRIKDVEEYITYVAAGYNYGSDLVSFYSKTVNNNIQLKKEFIESLHILSEEIYDITIDTTTVPDNPIILLLFENGQNLPLFMMGDGTIKLFRIILEIIMSKNARLMIDEIDNGMHFSRMKKVWEVILKVAVKNNTQLFITTHDSECLRAFKEVLESKELKELQNKVASYTLVKTNNHETKSVRFNFEEFEHAIDYSLNIRG